MSKPPENKTEELERRVQALSEQIDVLQRQNDRLAQRLDAAEQQSQTAIATRLLYEQMLSACSQVLLANIEDREEALAEALYELLLATGSSRVYICKNNVDSATNALYFRQRLEMCALSVPSLETKFADPGVFYHEKLSRWQEVLSRGQPISGSIDQFSQPEQEYLKARNVKSILVLPTWVNGQWYGFIGFDDIAPRRRWNAEDIKMLQTAVDLIGAYIGRKRAEQALRESEEKYRTLIEQSTDAIFLIYGGRFELVNRRFTEIFGVTQQDIEESEFTFSNIISSQQARFRELTRSIRQTGEHRPPYEFVAKDKTGNKIYIELVMSYPLYKRGLATQGIIRDITDRKQIEEEKRQAYEKIQQFAGELAEKVREEQYQRQIATMLADVVASVSLTLTPNEILNQILLKLQRLVPFDSATVYLMSDDNCLVLQAAHGIRSDFVQNKIPPDQSQFFSEMTTAKSYILVADTSAEGRQQFWIAADEPGAWIGAPLIVAQQVIGFLAVHQHRPGAYFIGDAELVQAFAHQVAQTIHNARLFTELKETQAQLVQRERLAALGQMSATVAHELRNPLMSLRMGIEYLTFEVPVDEPLQRVAKLITANMDRIESVVDNILFATRTPKMSPVTGSLNALINQEMEKWEMKLAQKQIACRVDLASQLPDVYLDLTQIERVLSNLIGNSIDASAGPNCELWVSLHGDNGWQVITVGDNGSGISEADQKKIFEPFFTTKSRGTGLGLAIVKQIIDSHGGQISVWSKPGQGTTFTIRLPQTLSQ